MTDTRTAPAGRHVNANDESTIISRTADHARHIIGAAWRNLIATPAPRTVTAAADIARPTNREG